MTTLADAGVAELAIVVPTTRVALSVPEDVPLAEQLPALLRRFGHAPHDWALARPDGSVLDLTQTPAQLAIGPGDLLRLVPRGTPASVATEPEPRWAAVATRRCGLATLTGTGVLGALLLVLLAPTGTASGVAAAVIGLALLATAALLARWVGDAAAGLLTAATALPYGFVGGGLLLGGTDPDATSLLAAAAALTLYSALAAMGVAARLPAFIAPGHRHQPAAPEQLAARISPFVAAGLAAAAVALSTLPVLTLGIPAAAAAAVLAAVAVGCLPVLPPLAYRLASLARLLSGASSAGTGPDRIDPAGTNPAGVDPAAAEPNATEPASIYPTGTALAGTVPTGTVPTGIGLADNGPTAPADRAPTAGAEMLARTELAGHYLTALLAAAAALIVGCVSVMLHGGQWSGWVLSTVLGLLLLCRARGLEVLSQRVGPLLGGLATLAVVLAAGAAGPLAGLPAGMRLSVAVALLLLIGAAAGMYGLVLAGRRPPPPWPLLLDGAGLLLGVSVLPLTLAVCELYTLLGGPLR